MAAEVDSSVKRSEWQSRGVADATNEKKNVQGGDGRERRDPDNIYSDRGAKRGAKREVTGNGKRRPVA